MEPNILFLFQTFWAYNRHIPVKTGPIWPQSTSLDTDTWILRKTSMSDPPLKLTPNWSTENKINKAIIHSILGWRSDKVFTSNFLIKKTIIYFNELFSCPLKYEYCKIGEIKQIIPNSVISWFVLCHKQKKVKLGLILDDMVWSIFLSTPSM